jgi:hypothetical protein
MWRPGGECGGFHEYGGQGRLCPIENIQILSIQFFHLLGESAEICVCCNRVNLKGRIESAGQIVGAHCVHLAAPPSYALSVIPKDVHAFFSSQFPPLFGHPLSPHSMIKTMKQVCSSDHFFDRKFSFFNPYPNGLRGVRGVSRWHLRWKHADADENRKSEHVHWELQLEAHMSLGRCGHLRCQCACIHREHRKFLLIPILHSRFCLSMLVLLDACPSTAGRLTTCLFLWHQRVQAAQKDDRDSLAEQRTQVGPGPIMHST